MFRRTLLFPLLTVQHTAFVMAAVWLAPIESSFAALFLTWMAVPGYTAAIICTSARYRIFAATANGLVAATLLDYLFLAQGYFWAEPPAIPITLAFVYLLLGIVISTSCGAFVQTITSSLDAESITTTKQSLIIAAKRGGKLSAICVLASLPFLWLLGPWRSSIGFSTLTVLYSLGGIASGVLLASIVGIAHTAGRSQPSW